MMDTREVTYAFLEAFQAGDFDTAATYMADDFVFSGPTPEPISGPAWFGLSAALRAAFPDLSYNFRVVSVDGDVVATTTQLTGTHTGDLDLSGIGKMGIIPATGKTISLPEEEGEAIVEDGKVVSLHIHTTPESGIMGILSQLGVKLPQGS